MPDALYFEDFPLGEVVEYGGVDVSADEIIAFAREFDPQPFHTDEEAARGATGGLIASGWHTSALLLRMNCDAFLTRAAIIEESGIEEVRWERPVRPGDRLHVRRQTLASRPREAAGRGEVEFLYEVVNQDGVAAMTQRSLLVLKRRPQRSGTSRISMFYEDIRIGQSVALGQTDILARSNSRLWATVRSAHRRSGRRGRSAARRLGTACGRRRDAPTGGHAQRLARRDGRARRDPSAAWRLARLQRHALAAPGA